MSTIGFCPLKTIKVKCVLMCIMCINVSLVYPEIQHAKNVKYQSLHFKICALVSHFLLAAYSSGK